MFTEQNKITIIAEVGQNHQGDLDIAKQCIEEFARSGADIIKFQTRNNKYLFSDNAYKKIYNSENAFAETYGEHREKLELKTEWLPIIKNSCHKNGVMFMSTPFDEPSLDLICDIGVDLIKIASFDLGNLPFISRVADKGLPVVISTGGGGIDVIKESVELLISKDIEVAVLHCVSEYPTPVDRLGFESIRVLKKLFPKCTIGSSDHFNGILSGPIAYMMGARVFEKHVTLNRAWKGTDHSFALEPNGFRHFVRDIHRVPMMMKPKPEKELGKEYVLQKLGKSVIARRNLAENLTVEINDLSGKIFDQVYLPVGQSNAVIGKKLKRNISKGEKILIDDIY